MQDPCSVGQEMRKWVKDRKGLKERLATCGEGKGRESHIGAKRLGKVSWGDSFRDRS